MSPARLKLLLWTLRYLHPAQMVVRGRRIIRRRVDRVLRHRPAQPTDWRLTTFRPLWLAFAGEFAPFEAAERGVETAAAIAAAEGIAQGRFNFLNHEADLAAQGLGQSGWHDPQLSHLWRYHLHYFNYVRELLIWARSGHEVEAFAAFKAMAAGWIEHNNAFSGDGWHPYTLSLRTVNWLHAVAGFDAALQADQPFRQRFIGSLYGQVGRLASDLESDVRGNHLMENLRALVYAGVTFEGAEPQAWYDKALRMLEVEVAEQVLPDGGHFERAPGYHLVIMKDLLEIALCIERNDRPVPPWLRAAVQRMGTYTVAMLPPDDEVPLLKDTAWDAAPPPHDVLAAVALWLNLPELKRRPALTLYPFLFFGAEGAARWDALPVSDAPRASQHFKDSGFLTARDDTRADYLVLDAGLPCPTYLPAHAHADMLGFELLVDGSRVIVDSGIYEYTDGPWRRFFRSTRAHSTVEIAGENQSEVWGSFRVARRARPSEVAWQEAGDYVMLRGAHDGYLRLATPAKHRRTIIAHHAGFWLVADELLWQNPGVELPAITSYLHFAPAVNPSETGPMTWRLEGTPLWLTAFGAARQAVTRGQTEPHRQGWYSSHFGQLEENRVLELTPEAAAARSSCFGYILARDAAATVEMRDGQVLVRHGARDYTLLLPRTGTPSLQ